MSLGVLDRAADRTPPEAGWVAIGDAGDVPLLEGRSVTVQGRRIAVFRLPGGWAATDGTCPHRGGPLADGIVTESCVTCPLHGRRYSLSSGERTDAEGDVAVRTYAIRERDGVLELRLADSSRPGHAAQPGQAAQPGRAAGAST